MKKIIIVDIDHVLANSFWRDEMMTGPSTDWEAYHSASISDEALHYVADLVRHLWTARCYYVLLLTARMGKFRKLTLEWLLKHQIPSDYLLMREDNEWRPSPELKLALAKEFCGEPLNERIAFVLEDRDDVVAAFRAEGVTVLQVFGRAK